MNSLNHRIAFLFSSKQDFAELKTERKADDVGIFLGALAFSVVPLHCYKNEYSFICFLFNRNIFFKHEKDKSSK